MLAQLQRGVSVRRDRDLRRRRHVLHSLSDRNQHRDVDQTVPSAREQPCRRVAVALCLAQALESGRTLGAREPVGSARVFLRVWSETAHGLTAVARSVVSPDLMPAVPGPMPRAASGLPKTDRDGAAAVYFCACINRMFGRDPAGPAAPSLAETLFLCPDALVSRCGFRRMLPACAARRRGDRKAISRGTSTWRKPWPMRCGAGAMEELFPSSSTPPHAPLVSKRMSDTTRRRAKRSSTRASRSSTR